MISPERAQEIADTYYNDVYSYCYSTINFDKYEAEVLTQDVFLLFQQKCGELEDNNIKHWLLCVAKNKTKEFFKKKKKDATILSLDESFFDIEDMDIQKMFEDNLPMDDEEIEKYVNIVLKALTQKERELYRKIYKEKMTYAEIAEELNISNNAVASRVLRLKNKIRTIIKLMFTSVGQFIIRVFF